MLWSPLILVTSPFLVSIDAKRTSMGTVSSTSMIC
uniref:Uncharacterized protein n=1 Tax=Arundo donax TaxID=35708 RepID=A0A0A8ZG13_ARUDO